MVFTRYSAIGLGVFGALALVLGAGTIGAAAGRTHTVAPGETLFSIAAAELGAGERWRELASLNHLAEPFLIRPGEILRLPEAILTNPPADGAPLSRSAPSRATVPEAVPADGTPGAETRISFPPFPGSSSSSLVSLFPSPAADTAPVPLPAGAVLVSDADAAVAAALPGHPLLRAVRAEIEAARAGLEAARLAGQYNPELEVAGERSRTHASTDAGGVETPGEAAVQTGVFLSREFEIVGQARLREAVAVLELERALALAEAEERKLAAEIRLTFLETILAVHRRELTSEEEQLRRGLAAAAAARLAAGDAASLEVSLAEVEAARVAAERMVAEKDLRAARAAFRAAAGRPELWPAPEAAPAEPSPPPDSPPDIALTERRDLRAELLAERILRERARLLVAEGRPNISIGGGYRREERTDIVAWQVTLPLPLINRNRGDATRAEREADAVIARSDALRVRIREEVGVALENLNNSRQRVELLGAAVAGRSEANLRLLLEAYREGKIGLSEVVVHQGEAFQSRRAWLEARFEWQRAAVELDRALGINTTNGTR